MSDFRRIFIGLVALLFATAAAHTNAASYKLSKIAWNGDALHVEIETELPEGTHVNMSFIDRKDLETTLSNSVESTVQNGRLVANDFRSTAGNDTGNVPMRSGRYALWITDWSQPFGPFTGIRDITVPKGSKRLATKQKSQENEEAKESANDAAKLAFNVKPSWADDVFRVNGKLNVQDGTWLNVALEDKNGTLVSDEGFIWAQAEGGRFIAEGFTKDGWQPLSAGQYTVSITDKLGNISIKKSITVARRPGVSAKSRLAEVRAINVANYANAKDNSPAATNSEHVSDFQKQQSDAVLQHSGVDSVLNRLRSSGALRVECGDGKAWIDPQLWRSSDAEDKENVTRAIYESCGKGIDLYDAQSAKKLAKYSAGGFKAY